MACHKPAQGKRVPERRPGYVIRKRSAPNAATQLTVRVRPISRRLVTPPLGLARLFLRSPGQRSRTRLRWAGLFAGLWPSSPLIATTVCSNPPRLNHAILKRHATFEAPEIVQEMLHQPLRLGAKAART